MRLESNRAVPGWRARLRRFVAAWTLTAVAGAGTAHAVDITVVNQGDAGLGSLRNAIELSSTGDRILFDFLVPVPPVDTIGLETALPPITAGFLELDGRTLNNQGVPQTSGEIFIDASGATPIESFLVVDGGETTLVEVILIGAGASVELAGSGALLRLDYEVDRGSSVDYTGTGGLRKEGDGVLTLTGINTYTGGTRIDEGTLRVDALSLPGDVDNRSTLELLIGAADQTFAGAISGSGEVVKTGANTLELTGANAYTGGTRVNAGTLRGEVGALQGDIEIESGGTLAFSVGTADATFAGALSGSGTITKDGANILTLSGGGGFTGTTRIDAGTLRGTASSLSGDVDFETGTTLEFTDATSGSFGGVFGSLGAGAGTVVMSGSATLTLTGDSRGFEGLLDIRSGRVQGSAGTLPPTIQNAATLIFDQATDGTYTGAISGAGTVEKRGAGTLIFPDTLLYTGMTQVAAGRLQIDGTLVSSPVHVGAGGTLSGAGLVGGAITASGRIAPGASIGTLTAASTVDFQAGSRFQVEMQGDGTGDLLDATGAVTIDPDARLEPQFENITAPVTVRVLDSDTSISGTFEIAETGFTTVTPTYGATTLDLLLTPGGDAVDLAETTNQLSIAAAIDTPLPDTALEAAVATLKGSSVSATEARAIMDAIGGEILGALTAPRLALSRRLHDDAHARIRDGFWRRATPVFGTGGGTPRASASDDSLRATALAPGLTAWLDGFGILGDLEGDGATGSAEIDLSVAGTTLGLDHRFSERFLAGGAFGWARTNSELQGRAASASGDHYQGILYAGFVDPRFHVGVSGRYAYADMRSRRPIAYSTFAETAEGDLTGHDYGARVDAGINLAKAGPVFFQPFVGFDWTRLEQDGFDEKNAAAYGMAVEKETLDSRLLLAGLRVRTAVDMDRDTALFAEIEAAWQRELGDRDRPVRSTFLADLASTPMRVEAARPETDSFVAALRWSVAATQNLNAFASYTGRFNAKRQEHRMVAGLRFRF